MIKDDAYFGESKINFSRDIVNPDLRHTGIVLVTLKNNMEIK